MNFFSFLFFSLCFLLMDFSAGAQNKWLEADINNPAKPGSHTMENGVLTVVGAGIGEGLGRAHGQDQVHFVYTTLPAGDVEIIARVIAFEGKQGKGMGGIMIRDALAPTGMKAVAGFFTYSDTLNGTFAASYNPKAKHSGEFSQNYQTAMKLPFWLRLSRVGKDFAVSRSQDLKIWVQVHNQSGGVFAAEDPILAGFFAAGGDPESTATIKFDGIKIGNPELGYRSSWIGNNFGQASSNHVSNALHALWVSPDGTCFANSHYDEAGESAKIYKDGKVVGTFRKEYGASFGNSYSVEGSITGDFNHTYVASYGGRIYLTDHRGQSAATRQLYFAQSLWDSSRNLNVTSGMAAAGGELYVADSRAQKIRVAQTADKERYYTAGNSTIEHAPGPVAAKGLGKAAPEEVYQSQRECDYFPYQIPGLQTNVDYTFRYHFAEYTHDEPGKRVMEVRAGEKMALYDIVKESAGKLKAAVLDIPGIRADPKGVLSTTLGVAQSSPDRHMVICGIEVLDAQGKQLFALNSGGPAAGSFKSEVHELPARAFDFQRPGPMVADKRGELWIIQQAVDFGAGVNAMAIKYQGAIKCYRTNGTFTGRSITNVVNPTALAYDAKEDRLLIAENGPDQNIRIFGHLAKKPELTKEFGVKGGIYSGDKPGSLFDHKKPLSPRFYGLNGVGIDSGGNIYVACSATGTDLRKYSPEGKLIWMLNGLHFIDCADADPDSDGTQIYLPFRRYSMDYSKTAPGSEWKYSAHTWNPFKYGIPPRMRGSTAVVRRVGPNRSLMLYTSGQGQMDYIGIFRYEGDMNIPAGKISKSSQGLLEIWTDLNGDGLESPGEISTSDPAENMGHPQSFSIDQKGDVWIAIQGSLRHIKFKGLNQFGVPLYGTKAGDFEDIQLPGMGKSIDIARTIARVSYDAERDVMYVIGPARERKTDKDNPVCYLARYDQWSNGNRTAKWLKVLPDPSSDPNFMYMDPVPYGVAFHWMAFDVAVDKIFIAELWGPVHAFNADTGEREMVFIPGPEVSGSNAWEDANMGIRAIKRQNGEYIIFEENSGFGAKNTMYRWKPKS